MRAMLAGCAAYPRWLRDRAVVIHNGLKDWPRSTLDKGAARAAGFSRTEMMATMAGIPLYEVCGYHPVEEVLSAPIAHGFSISAAWSAEVWGRARGEGGPLDLTNFDRNQVKLRLSIDL